MRTRCAQGFGWSFVLELHATDEALASTNQTVKDAPHWLAVPKAWWRAPLGPGSGIMERLDHPVVHVSWADAKARRRHRSVVPCVSVLLLLFLSSGRHVMHVSSAGLLQVGRQASGDRD